MLLAIDIGNTMTNFGVFEEGKLVYTYVLDSDPQRTEDEHRARLLFMFQSASLALSSITEIIISSVVPSIGSIYSRLSQSLFLVKARVIGPGLKSGLRLKVDHPTEVGSDLVADCVSAKTKYGNSVFVADLGTASKYIYVDEEGAFAGLSIAPGLTISLSALVKGTASLPEIPLNPEVSVIGKNTPDCMNSGIIHGTVFQVKGFADAFEKAAGHSLKRVLTGGNSVYLKSLLPEFEYDKNLLLEGLYEINERCKK